MAAEQEIGDSIPQKFTSELHDMLCDLESNTSSSNVASDSKDIIRWEPDGKSFVMFDRKRFEAELMPIYFFRLKYNSFKRLLHLYGFKATVHKGQRRTAYWQHPLFIRDKPELAKQMKNLKVKNPGVIKRHRQQQRQRRLKESESSSYQKLSENETAEEELEELSSEESKSGKKVSGSPGHGTNKKIAQSSTTTTARVRNGEPSETLPLPETLQLPVSNSTAWSAHAHRDSNPTPTPNSMATFNPNAGHLLPQEPFAFLAQRHRSSEEPKRQHHQQQVQVQGTQLQPYFSTLQPTTHYPVIFQHQASNSPLPLPLASNEASSSDTSQHQHEQHRPLIVQQNLDQSQHPQLQLQRQQHQQEIHSRQQQQRQNLDLFALLESQVSFPDGDNTGSSTHHQALLKNNDNANYFDLLEPRPFPPGTNNGALDRQDNDGENQKQDTEERKRNSNDDSNLGQGWFYPV